MKLKKELPTINLYIRRSEDESEIESEDVEMV